jgi:uncharacterized protein YutE (UPF0331/DUF86 family)
MTPPRLRPLLQRKLISLASYLDELDATLPATVTAYAADSTVRRAVERLVQGVMEATLDAGDLLLAEEGRMAGETAREIFEALSAAGVLDDSLRRRFAYEYSALRNRIVHDYDELDNAVVWQAARQLVPDGRALVAALTARLAAGPPAP